MSNGTSKCITWTCFAIFRSLSSFFEQNHQFRWVKREGYFFFFFNKMTNFSKNFFFLKKMIFSKTTVNPFRKKISTFLKKYVFFHKCCKNTKIVSGYAYFTQKLFKMCLKDVDEKKNEF